MAVNVVPKAPVSELPTREDFERVRRLASDTLAGLEALQVRLQRYSDAHYDDPNSPADAPDEAYVGALYRFVDDARGQRNDLGSTVERLEKVLVDIDCIGRNADFRARIAS